MGTGLMSLIGPSSNRSSESNIGYWLFLLFWEFRIHSWDFFNPSNVLYKVSSDCVQVD